MKTIGTRYEYTYIIKFNKYITAVIWLMVVAKIEKYIYIDHAVYTLHYCDAHNIQKLTILKEQYNYLNKYVLYQNYLNRQRIYRV